jgi:hypothetical protein
LKLVVYSMSLVVDTILKALKLSKYLLCDELAYIELKWASYRQNQSRIMLPCQVYSQSECPLACSWSSIPFTECLWQWLSTHEAIQLCGNTMPYIGNGVLVCKIIRYVR